MRLLLDTNILLWMLTGDPRATPAARTLIDASESTLVVSVISVWEVAIKTALPRIRQGDLPLSAAALLASMQNVDITPVSLSAEVAVLVADLPLLHGDPFDRMLIVQAQALDCNLLTSDRALAAYGDFVTVV